MKITPENYKEAFERALFIADPRSQWISELPEKIREGHEFLLEATDSFSDWNVILNDKEFREIIEMYFTELSNYIERGEGSQKQVSKKSANIHTSNQHTHSEKQEVFALLLRFIPKLPEFLDTIRPGRTTVFSGKRLKGIRVSIDMDSKGIFSMHFYESRKTEEGSLDDGILVSYRITIDLSAQEAEVASGKVKHDPHYEINNSGFIAWLGAVIRKGIIIRLSKKDLTDPFNEGTPSSSKKKSRPKRDVKPEETKFQKPAFKFVEHITEEVKFIKRYVGLHNKVKSRSAILAFIKSLQRSIVQKLIRKTSTFAEEIRTIQEKLVDAYNKTNGRELKVLINENDLSHLVGIAGGEEVYQSIKIIKRYVGLQGREVDEKILEGFLKQIQNAIKSMKVSQDDPYYDEVKGILSSVKKLVNGTKLKIGKAELHGLEGILNGCGCMDNSPGKGRNNKGLGSITPGVMSAEQMANLTVEELNFTYPWDMLLGKPATNFSVMFHGDPGSGKTTLLIKFVEYLANNFGKVLYVSSEEHGASTLVKKINALLPVRPSRLDFAANLSEPDLSQYDFIVLDSVNNLKLKLDDFKQLKKDYPQTSFIVVLQHTKDGNYRGGKDWEHDIEMAVKVEHGIATVYRTRYGVYGTLDFFSHFRITPDMFK